MTEKQRRIRLANELSEIMTLIMRDAGVLFRAMSDLGEDEKTVAQVCQPLKRYGGERGQAYGGDVLKVVKKFAPARKPKPKRPPPPKPSPLPSNVVPIRPAGAP